MVNSSGSLGMSPKISNEGRSQLGSEAWKIVGPPRAGMSNLWPEGWTRHTLAMPTPVLGKGGRCKLDTPAVERIQGRKSSSQKKEEEVESIDSERMST